MHPLGKIHNVPLLHFQIDKPRSVKRVHQKRTRLLLCVEEKKNGVQFGCSVESKISIIYLENLSLEVREVSKNVTTLPNIANPHTGIYREISQQVLASIEETQTDRRN